MERLAGQHCKLSSVDKRCVCVSVGVTNHRDDLGSHKLRAGLLSHVEWVAVWAFSGG